MFSGDGHFNQEQVEAACRYFGLTAAETEFLLQMVEYNRAGTVSLRNFYEGLLREKQKKYSGLKNILSMPDALKASEEAEYYSRWHYAAVHVLILIPKYRTRDALASKLNLPLSRIDKILEFLTKTKLCEKVGTKYQLLRPLLHLDKSSPLISKHHGNWRLRALSAIDEGAEDEIHYSSVFTLSVDAQAQMLAESRAFGALAFAR